ncbi:DNA methyltransferase [Pararhizobium sp. IMCC21322]|uniref:class I SAM-dependent DNA methyltransferase n=1 Tax=Pararhizobium sp. IMCC21322 TaxID=3067903 RepID=UPI002741571A|nr:DNA methyltransferase [Pararhizobium sp. IMCC21322]
MNAVEIEEAISGLAELPFDAQEFPFAFLQAFGNKPTTLKRLRSGTSNKSDLDGVLQTNNIHILVCAEGEVTQTLAALKASPATTKAKAKFILATDGIYLEAEDLTTGETIACAYTGFPDHFGFFLPLAGISTVRQIRESAFDIKATGRLNRLYVELLKDNSEWGTTARRHDMNHFMARLIFCFFAEDTEIFKNDDQFTGTIERMSEKDSSNTHDVISELFRAMNTRKQDHTAAGIARWASVFPYVNGGLFSGNMDVPRFSKIARSYLLHIGSLDWTKINPDIFGSMIQAVADDEERGALGMHYTSVPNILKVLNPLFLDDLREKLEEAGDNHRKLLNLRNRMAKIRVFDPACGSGNFLVIAYKEMRAIEAEINKQRDEADRRTEIPITNYRGIELRDFPAEIARLALIIAEYQCDVTYRGQKEALAEFLPLDAMNWITCGNSLRLDWLSICPPTGTGVKYQADDLFHSPLEQAQIDFENKGGETYICGNPPFAGQKKKTKEQRDDMALVMPSAVTKYGELDYVAPFFVKVSQYLKHTKGAAALVSTNSIVQGRQVPALWPSLLRGGLEITFGHRSFIWKNSATKNASVYCVVVGLGFNWQRTKYLYEGGERKEVVSISGYLTPGTTVGIKKRKTPLSKDLQLMKSGNMPLDNGNLLLSVRERKQLLDEFPASKKFIRPVVGAKEINQGLQRYCLWIDDQEIDEAKAIPPILKRLHECKKFRETSSAPELASTPHAFRDRHRQAKNVILLPNLSSERRRFRVPIVGSSDVIATNLALAIYDGMLFQVSILASRMHHLWVEAVCGKFKQDFRYSNDLGWHTFPIPTLIDSQKAALTKCADDLLLVREQSFPACLNDLYNSSDVEDRMPNNLRAAHERNDETIERIYIGRRFRNDTERLEKLFALYTKMTKKIPEALRE